MSKSREQSLFRWILKRLGNQQSYMRGEGDLVMRIEHEDFF